MVKILYQCDKHLNVMLGEKAQIDRNRATQLSCTPGARQVKREFRTWLLSLGNKSHRGEIM